MIIRDLKVTINREWVLHQIDCPAGSSIYEEVSEEYQQIEAEIYSLCEPVFLIQYGTVDSRTAEQYALPQDVPLLFVVSSIGRKISEYSTRAFQKGDYLKGMLSDAMADSALTSLEKEAIPYIRDICRDHHMGIEKRLDAPKDIPMAAQRLIFERTQAHELCGMSLSSGYMLDPVKSGALIYVLTEDTDKFNYRHDCRKCKRYDCKLRSVPDIPVEIAERAVSGSASCSQSRHTAESDSVSSSFTLWVKEGQSLLDALIAWDPSFSAVCGGRGFCGKCQIQALKGNLSVSEADKKIFSDSQLSSGFRLACQAYPTEPLKAALKFQKEEDFSAVSEYIPVGEDVSKTPENREADRSRLLFQRQQPDYYGIAIDIGTTTIALQLLSLKSGKPVKAHTLLNHQRSFGADVISRIKASTEGKQQELYHCIRQDLNEGIRNILASSEATPETIKEIIISGNTTMIHLLMKYDCSGLGVFPFTPVNTDQIEGSCESILGISGLHARVRILPSISAFVGGDIVSGMYYCGMHQDKDYTLLIDLGTNGEISLCGQGRMIAASTAAGPAFEGGNIQWGTGSIAGAICGITITEKEPLIRTIGGQPPVGICGSGALEILAELLEAELIDETGYLDEEYGDVGFPLAKSADGELITFTQKDIRELQLAKSALRAGIETLCLRFGISPKEISRVYLAGGFGLKLNCRKAIRIGLLPEVFDGKITAVGNSSLGGCAKFLLDEKGQEQIFFIARETREIPLASDKDFNRFYMEHMYF